jgi:hypothetical protein
VTKRRSPSLSQYVRLRVEPVNCQPGFEGCKAKPGSERSFRIRLELSTLNFQLSVVAIAPGNADILIGGSLVATAKKFAVVVEF